MSEDVEVDESGGLVSVSESDGSDSVKLVRDSKGRFVKRVTDGRGRVFFGNKHETYRNTPGDLESHKVVIPVGGFGVCGTRWDIEHTEAYRERERKELGYE